MARIGCLWVPQLPLAALQRVDPNLQGRPVAVVDGVAKGAVRALSSEAEAVGVRLRMTAAQARAVCDELLVREADTETMSVAVAALADVAQTVSARVEVADDGVVFFDCAGSAMLCASERELASIVGARAERQGLPAWVGVADSKLAARVAARDGCGVGIIHPGETAARFAALPVGLLDPPPPVAATLASWGLQRIGDLMALPAGAVAHRLGPAGATLIRRARGEDETPLQARSTPHTFTETMQLEYSIERLEPLVFVVRRLIDCLTRRLALHGLVCASVELQLHLDSGRRVVRPLALAAPTAESKTLLTVVRAHLEREPPGQAVQGVGIACEAVRMRTAQLDFFQPSGPAPAVLAATIARIAALCGPDRVGAPVRAASHRPGAVAVAPFTGEVARVDGVDGAGRCGEASPGYGASALSSGLAHQSDSVPPSEAASSPSVYAPVALRAFRPPAELTVFENAGRLDYVRGRGFGGRVVHVAGPWKLRGEWWGDDPYAREYYDVELSDGGVYRIYRDVRARCWRADGVYD